MTTWILRKEAYDLGIGRSRLDYLHREGLIKAQKNSDGFWVFDKDAVSHYAKIPMGTPLKKRKPRTKATATVTNPAPIKKTNTLELAFIALGVCAQLMKHEQIKAKFKCATVEDLLNAADELESKIKEGE